jgi:hypothetical protein
MNNFNLCKVMDEEWKVGKQYGSVVSNMAQGYPSDFDEAYGGYLVCESTAKDNAELIASIPEMIKEAVALKKELCRMSDLCSKQAREIRNMKRIINELTKEPKVIL